MKTPRLIGLFLTLLPLAACSTHYGLPGAKDLQPSDTVQSVDLNRYLGKWYEIASFPQSFQKGCTATTAEYSLKPNGEIKVLNSCRKDTLDGLEKKAEGRAQIVDTQTNARLRVSFFGPFFGDYWIFSLGEKYDYAMVGSPGHTGLWILSRTRTLPKEVTTTLLARATELGFDVNRIQWTLQPSEATSEEPSESPTRE